MKFMADIKKVNLAPNKTTIVLEVAPDQTGDIEGLQILMSQLVSVSVDPIQTAFELAEGV